MADDWKVGFNEAVREFLTTHGRFVEFTEDNDHNPNFYGWGAYHSCQVASIDMDTMREEGIYQFNGTFTDASYKYGIEVRATCLCGEFTNKWLRWDGTVSEILTDLLKEG